MITIRHTILVLTFAMSLQNTVAFSVNPLLAPSSSPSTIRSLLSRGLPTINTIAHLGMAAGLAGAAASFGIVLYYDRKAIAWENEMNSIKNDQRLFDKMTQSPQSRNVYEPKLRISEEKWDEYKKKHSIYEPKLKPVFIRSFQTFFVAACVRAVSFLAHKIIVA